MKNSGGVAPAVESQAILCFVCRLMSLNERSPNVRGEGRAPLLRASVSTAGLGRYAYSY